MNWPDRAALPAIALLLILIVPDASAAPPGEGAPFPSFPSGPSEHEFAGLGFHLDVPRDREPGKKLGLLVALHGMGSSGREFATWFEPLTDEGFVVCAPRSTGNAWMKPDIEKVEKIVDHLIEKLPIDEGRLHGVGFSNGGAHLGFLVFGSRPYATACWMGSGFTGGRIPRFAKERMAVLAMAGEQDPAYGAAKSTAERLSSKVRHTDFRSQPDLGHEIPDRLMPYYYYWLAVMEGKHVPGADRSFFWVDDLEVGLETIRERKLGGFVYFFSDQDTGSEEDRHLQHAVFFDPEVRRYGRQLVAILADVDLAEDYVRKLGLTKTPAVVVVSADGRPVKVLDDQIAAKALAAALKSLAPGKR